MPQSTAWVLGLIYVFSELGLALQKRAKAGELMLGGAAEHRALIAEEYRAADF